MKIKARLISVLSAVLLATGAIAQIDNLNEPVQVMARPSVDSVILRWAPIRSDYWLTGNNAGYIIERYTLVRNGKTLDQPEKKILVVEPIKPFEEAGWIPIVSKSKYIAIAAQALLGETFELNIEKGDAFDIVNKVKETEQRFSIALFCADLLPEAARALGLYYVDRTVVKGERYLYRVILNASDPVKGSVFADTDESYNLPQPFDFSLQADGNVIILKWDQSYHKRIYNAYFVERSDDGTNFTRLSEDPSVTLRTGEEETRYQYVNDTLPYTGKEYHYRIKGISPFGETGPPSEVKTAKGKKVITTLPHITSAISIDNKTISVEWEFPTELNNSIEGFYVERAISHAGAYARINNDTIVREARSFVDNAPGQTNYYRVTVLTADKDRLNSFPYFIHLTDSMPPAAPSGMEAIIDDAGNVTLSWKPSIEPDIFGYRIYRAYYLSDEFAQITSEAITQTKYRDRVELQSLNKKIHYRLMAIDRNQNHSQLSPVYSFDLPDKVPPVSPVFFPVRASFDGVELRWMPSPSDDVKRYDVYRKGDNQEWIRISSILAGDDSVYTFTDIHIKSGESRFYTVVAVDKSGLESSPSDAVKGERIKRNVWPAVKMEIPEIDRSSNKVLLKWSYDEINIRTFQVYRSVNDEPITLHRSVSSREFVDHVRPGQKYLYKVVAVYNDGSRSELGAGVSLTF